MLEERYAIYLLPVRLLLSGLFLPEIMKYGQSQAILCHAGDSLLCISRITSSSTILMSLNFDASRYSFALSGERPYGWGSDDRTSSLYHPFQGFALSKARVPKPETNLLRRLFREFFLQ